VLLPLYELLAELLRRNGLERAAELEFGCLSAVVEIELAGIGFDAPAARRLLSTLTAQKAAVETELVEIARSAGFRPPGKKSAGTRKHASELNPASARDVLTCLKLLGHAGVTDTRDVTLRELAIGGCQFADKLLVFRERAKQAKFVEDWLNKQHPVDDRIHPSLRQLNEHCTGRLSCLSPNLQQIPRDKDFRSLFCASKGRKLVIADYSGIELRIMAFLSGDQAMMQAFQDGRDLHRLTAAAITGKSPEDVTKDERQAAKAINFGLIYGCGADRLVQSAKYEYGTELSFHQAQAAKRSFFSAYPGIAVWHSKQRALLGTPHQYWFHSYEKGFFAINLVSVVMPPGRRRVWPNYMGKSQARFTVLVNTPDQGCGASMMKLALINIHKKLIDNAWNEVKIVATVHDELVLEAPEELADAVKSMVVSEMVSAGEEFIRPVPVEVEAIIGDNWAEK